MAGTTEEILTEEFETNTEVVDPNAQQAESEETDASNIVAHIQYTLGEMLYSYDNIEELYDTLSANQFSDMMWIYKYYTELFSQGPTVTIDQGIKDFFSELLDSSDILYSEAQVIEHKIFKNILFNAKQVFILQESDGKPTTNWVWKEMTSGDLSSLYDQQNRFYLARIGMSSKMQDSLGAMGMTIHNTTRGIANSKHNVGYRYFIISSEPVTLEEYVDLLPQTRNNEQSFRDIFDEIDSETPEFIPEDIYAYTYYKSRYVPQSDKQFMTLKNTKQNPTTQEADEMTTPSTISTAPSSVSSPTGY